MNACDDDSDEDDSDEGVASGRCGSGDDVTYLGAIVSAVIYGNVYGARATTAGLHMLGWVVIGIAAVFLLITVFDRSLARIGRVAPGTGA